MNQITSEAQTRVFGNAIAIIGMAGRFPGANDVRELWRNVAGGICSIRTLADDELVTRGVPESVWRQANYVKAAACVEDIERFDAAFFGYTPRDAEIMDPQHRLFLECAWHALEDAGYPPDAVPHLVGVFAGSAFSTYLLHNLYGNRRVTESAGEIQVAIGNDKDALSSTVSYKLDLKGPSVAVQTFCSTSLVAVHMGCQSLLTYESDLVLAGGVAIGVPQGVGYVYEEGGILSPDGHCRSFDRKAAGSVMGNGVGVVVLKRAEEAMGDGDHIYALIRGSAVNNDGRVRVGYTAPGLEGQAEVMAEALANAGVEPESIGYVEAHGTATALGDAVELAAMKRVFGGQTGGERRCALGTIKPNVGHLDRASGVTGLIKAALMLERRQLPPQVDYEEAGAETDLAGSGFYVNRELRVWEAVSGVRRAGVSSFGLGGTNAHVVLEEAPVKGATGQAEGEAELLVVSAKSQRAVEEAQKRLGRYLAEGAPGASLGEVAYTLQVGRCGFNHRRIVVSGSKEEAAGQLELGEVLGKEQAQRGVKVGWWFPGERDWEEGQGAELEGQWAVYGAERRALWEELRGEAGAWEQAEGTVKRLIWGYGLARVLKRLGVEWEWTGGQGEGAWVAACVRGEVSVLEAVRAVRGGQEAEERARPAGWMGLELVVGPGREGLSLIGREGKGAGAAKRHLLKTLGRLWLEGVGFAWTELHGPGSRRRVSLPPYAFEPTRFWVEPERTESKAVEAIPARRGANCVKDRNPEHWFYIPVWKASPAQDLKSPAVLAPEEVCLVFADTNGPGMQVYQQLRHLGQNVILVQHGDEFVHSEAGILLRAKEPRDYVIAIDLIRKSGRRISNILHCSSLGPATESNDHAQAFESCQERGALSLLHLARALVQNPVEQQIKLLLVTNNTLEVTGKERLCARNATMPGICLVLGQEEPSISTHHVDLDIPEVRGTLDSETLVLLEREVFGPATARPVAYREGRRLVLDYQRVPLPAVPEIAQLYKQKGLYVITGGLGKIGLLLAHEFAKVAQARLLLIHRSAFPLRSGWAGWLDSHAGDEPASLKIRELLEIERLGGEVELARADVSKEAELQEALESAVAKFGPVRGVIHAAGESRDEAFGVLAEMTPCQVQMHFRPKAYGLLSLDQALRDHAPDFCIAFSSLSSVLGGLGFAAYTAANMFLDAYCAAVNRRQPRRWLTVNWDTWNVKAEAHGKLGASIAQYAMSPEEALEAFHRVISQQAHTHLVQSTGPLHLRMQQWVDRDGTASADHCSARLPGRRPDISTSYVPPDSKFERQLAAAWQEVLGIDQIGRHDNFFDLGGNSLIGLKLVSRIRKELQVHVPVVALFEAPTVSSLANYLRPGPNGAAKPDQTIQAPPAAATALPPTERTPAYAEELAIVGMSGRFPGAEDVGQFWSNICNGVESLTWFSDEELLASGIPAKLVTDPDYVKARPILQNPEWFDARFFGYTPREAELMDPQHRLFLECCWEALENAGHDSARFPGRIGVFGGTNISSYLLTLLSQPGFACSLGHYESSYQAVIGNDKDSLTTAVSYKLNLTGPSFAVQTFCSTSLVAAHLACRSLLVGECDMALAGGVSIRVPVKAGHLYQQGGMESPDGHCRTFDAQAQGCTFGDGVAVVVLKRLADAISQGDQIYAVIKGSAINNDGSLKVGYTAPSVKGQAQVVAAALSAAKVTADTIGYLEAHGTATELGDPIEVTALSKAFRATTDRKQFCAIGSVKPNVGHLDRAAGVASLIKTALALNSRRIPPNINYEKANPEINFEDSPFFVATKLEVWSRNGQPRRAGVNSLGMGGTNVHVVLEEAPEVEAGGPSRGWQLVMVSGRSAGALAAATSRLGAHLTKEAGLDLADACYTLGVGRRHFEHRRVLVCRKEEAVGSILEAGEGARLWSGEVERGAERKVAFMFPGVGEQYVGMGRELYEAEGEFRRWVDYGCERLQGQVGMDLREVLLAAEPEGKGEVDLRQWAGREHGLRSAGQERLRRTVVAQPLVFVVEYALARLLESYGVRAVAVLGHSLGEYVAACVSGVMCLEEGLEVVGERARWMEELPGGQMLAVQLGEGALRGYLRAGVEIGVVNGAGVSVLSGRSEVVAEVGRELEGAGVACRVLETTHAFHSEMMKPLAGRLLELMRGVKLERPRIGYVSNVTGGWAGAEVLEPEYWARHMCGTVRFGEGLGLLWEEPERVLVEVGPGQALSSFARQHERCGAERGGRVVGVMKYGWERRSEMEALVGALGKMWLAGVEVDWPAYWRQERRRRVSLPTYPFERQKFWIAPSQLVGSTPPNLESLFENEPARQTDVSDWVYAPSWKRVPIAPLGQPSLPGPWLILSDETGIGRKLVAALNSLGIKAGIVFPGESFAVSGDGEFVVRPREKADFQRLWELLRNSGAVPQHIVHLWTLNLAGDFSEDASQALIHALDLGFHTLVSLTQVLGEQATQCQVSVVTNGLADVFGGEPIHAPNATLMGPCKVVPQEYCSLKFRCIDIGFSSLAWREDSDLQLLKSELFRPITDSVVALRNAHRWVQSFEAMRLEPPSGRADRLRNQGVYLITGGLGGLGLALATHLARTVKARLILVSRSDSPDREMWRQMVNQPGAAGNRAKRLVELEELGADFICIRADVADYGQMAEAVQRGVARFGPINGVFHTAGLPPSGLIQFKTPDMAAKVMAPKVQGALVLRRLFKESGLDFLVFYSSMSSTTGGGPGQVDYCAANAFLDACARTTSTAPPVFSVAWGEWLWDAWQDGLLGFPEEARTFFIERRRRYGIPFEEGLEALRRILGSDLRESIVATQYFPAMVEGSKNFTTAAILGKIGEFRKNRPVAPRPQIGSAYLSPRDETEKQVADVWAELLGIREIGVEDNFFELGGNSLLGVDLMGRLRKSFKIDHLPAYVLYEAPTVASLAKHLTGVKDEGLSAQSRQARAEHRRRKLHQLRIAAET